MSEYETQAKDFLKSTGTKIAMQEIRPELCARPLWIDPTSDKIQHGAEWRIALMRPGRRDYRFSFWNSIDASAKGESPTTYDILACMSGSINIPVSFSDFILEYGYEMKSEADYNRLQSQYRAIVEENEALHELYSPEELDRLAEIN